VSQGKELASYLAIIDMNQKFSVVVLQYYHRKETVKGGTGGNTPNTFSSNADLQW
jgi:hypothetical protein